LARWFFTGCWILVKELRGAIGKPDAATPIGHEKPVDGVISEAQVGQAFAIRGTFAVRSRFRFSGLFTLP
jgi:hypothetical protein